MKKLLIVLLSTTIFCGCCHTKFDPFTRLDLDCEAHNIRVLDFNAKLFSFAQTKCAAAHLGAGPADTDIQKFAHCVADELDRLYVEYRNCKAEETTELEDD